MIERLYVHNFRCLENFSLDLAGRSSALMIGRNGAGKSTVLKCLTLFQSIGRGSNRVGSLISASDFTQNRTDQPMRLEAEVLLGEKRFRYGIAFEGRAHFREARIQEEFLTVDGEVIFSRNASQINLPTGQSFGLDGHVFALPIINERPGERSIQEIKIFFSNMILVSPIPANMTGFSEEASMEMETDASNYASCLRALLGQKPAAYGKFDSYLKAVLPDFSSIENVERGEHGQQLMVRFGQDHHQDELAVEFKALSDGEKCFFLSAHIVASNAVSSPVFCMWDEPDDHLSLSEVGQFITGLRKMAHRGGQFLATTHHPETIRKFSDETTLVLTRKSHLDPTVVRPLSELGYNGDLIHALIRDEIISQA